MLRGVARHGVPAAAVARALGLDGVGTRFAPEPMPVFAPSLERDADADAD
jgi:hypothetical protein